MSLATLIQKNGLMGLATATAATPATEQCRSIRTVADVATVAVANAPTAHYRWRVTLADGTPFEVCCSPELTEVEMREHYPQTVLEVLPDGAVEAAIVAASDKIEVRG